jgi:hypothetical protein
MSDISMTISNFLDSAEKIYTLARAIREDIKKYSESKEKEKVKLQIEKLRDLVGTIDAMITKLHTDLIVMEVRGQTQMYQKYIDNYEMIYNKIQRMGVDIIKIVQLPYFDKYPMLRETLLLKIGFEAFNIQKEEKDRYWKDYMTFKEFVNSIYGYTRAALMALNIHLESQFNG